MTYGVGEVARGDLVSRKVTVGKEKFLEPVVLKAAVGWCHMA